MLKRRWAVATVALLAIGVVGTDITAQKGNKPPAITGGPSDAVFADFGDVGTANSDRIRSDAFATVLCHKDGETSRYCGGTYTDPETGLTYDGVGPECSRINSGSSGYAFRTISSKCPSYDPPTGGVQRKLVLDFGGHHGVARCLSGNPNDALIERTVNGDKRELNVCGWNLVDDVRIVADGMFTNTSSTVTVYISLHAPPLANTTQFLLEFTRPLFVGDLGYARELIASPGQDRAVLWEMMTTRNGKLQKASTPVGEYSMPFSLRARKAPMQ